MKHLLNCLLIYALFISLPAKSQNLNDPPPYDIEYDSLGNPTHVKNEFIICFHPSLVNKSAINNLDLQEGKVSDFIDHGVLQSIIGSGFFDEKFLDIPIRRVFTRLTTQITTSTARDEQTIVPMPPFWSTFVMTWDGYYGIDYEEAEDSLAKFSPYVTYTEFNKVCRFFAAPNDYHYTHQGQQGVGWYAGNNTSFYHIGANEAWDYHVGSPNIKVGVYDTGINQLHDDLSEDGSNTNSKSRVKGGHNFIGEKALSVSSSNDVDGHGSMIAGIIGAIRDNDKGIAGIAGGDYGVTFGVRLYDMKIANSTATYGRYDQVTDAIQQGATSIGSSGYGLHVMNHSWGVGTIGNPLYDANLYTLKRVMVFSAENQCAQIAAVGNLSGTIFTNTPFYPAQYRENLVLRVGGYDEKGIRSSSTVTLGLAKSGGSGSLAGGGILGPFNTSLYTSLDHATNNNYNQRGPGTSVATAFVSGGAALVMGYYKDYPYKFNELSPEDVFYLLKKHAKITNDPKVTGDQHRNLDLSNVGVFGNIRLPDNKIRHIDIAIPPSKFIANSSGTQVHTNNPPFEIDFCIGANDGVYTEDPNGNTVGIYCPSIPNGTALN